MADDLINIPLTETEIIHIMDSLRERIADLQDDHALTGEMESADLADELQDIEHDLLEAVNRRDDGWRTDAVPSAALAMAEEGIDACGQVKGTSRAAQRREQQIVERMMKGTATPCHPDFMNDPADW